MGKANCSRAMGKWEEVLALSLEMTDRLQPGTQLRKRRFEAEGCVNVRKL